MLIVISDISEIIIYTKISIKKRLIPEGPSEIPHPEKPPEPVKS